MRKRLVSFAIPEQLQLGLITFIPCDPSKTGCLDALSLQSNNTVFTLCNLPVKSVSLDEFGGRLKLEIPNQQLHKAVATLRNNSVTSSHSFLSPAGYASNGNPKPSRIAPSALICSCPCFTYASLSGIPLYGLKRR